jgi:hypothetical protein
MFDGSVNKANKCAEKESGQEWKVHSTICRYVLCGLAKFTSLNVYLLQI